MRMFDDSKISLTLIRDQKSQNQIKHINIIYYHMYTIEEDWELAINWISSFSNRAFQKTLRGIEVCRIKTKFEELLSQKRKKKLKRTKT